MDIMGGAVPCKFDDQSTSDIIVCLRNGEGRPDKFYSHSNILINKSKFFADQLTYSDSGTCIEIHCSKSNYDSHLDLLRLLYIPADLLLESLNSVKSAIGILQLAVQFNCEEITNGCVRYLEAVPWEDKEEEVILKVVSELGPIAMPILARIEPVDLRATKNVFVSAVRFATSIGGPCPPFADDLKTSAQEQVEYMLSEDADTPLVTADDEVKSVMKTGFFKIFSSFVKELSFLLLESDLTSATVENKILQSLSDVEWISNILPKMELMKEFVSNWVEISDKVLTVVEDRKLDSSMWGLKIKVIEMTGKVLEAVGYGNVILPGPCRVRLLKTWLPYIRKMKPLLEAKGNKETDFPHKMNDELCENIESAIVQLVLALPSNDQADILADWMKTEQVKYPDLSEAFEVWCYRTKSAKRRLLEGGLDRVGNTTLSL
ncbi:BTB/POZ domain-containing protein [Melia azedarach]|uniref:BTB/POZ domain-containing protein n=1 Tax=Melia azedarach TaxID=155640 RepID=A0ACC1XKS1_MELAZ|nr:BTB/POZ domain-containing protein [Melia azedarach]